jgi:bla regulator protein BlaR1
VNLTYLSPLANHLWQSTLFAAIAGMLTLLLRTNRARARHWVWLAASWKFLVPFSVLISVGGHMHSRTAPQATQSNLSVAIDEVSQPFTAPTASLVPMTAAPPAASTVAALLWTIWACGFLGITCSWWVRWRRIRAAVRTGSPLGLELPIRAVSSPMLLEPGVFGMFRPVMLLPQGILDRLTPAQLEGVVAHELCHVYHRDNLTAAIHMFVETVFWFHPLVWWIGKRMVEEREIACDEEVLRLGNEPRVYAEGILTICRFSLESRLPCFSGVMGANLRKRIEEIMANRTGIRLSLAKKALLAVAGMSAVAAPTIVGMLNPPFSRAQSQAESHAAAFEVSSIRPAAIWKAGGEGSKRSKIEYSPTSLSMWNVDLTDCVQWAYGIKFYQISGPGFPGPERYDILAKTGSSVPVKQLRAMLQDLLEKRFQLRLHRQTKMLPVYELVVANGGPRLPVPKADTDLSPTHATESLPRVQDGSFVFQDTSMTEFAAKLSLLRGVDLPVIDRTGIKGLFDITLKSAANAILQDDGPSVSTLVQEQLGLKLVSAKAAIEVIVIDHVERPSEN